MSEATAIEEFQPFLQPAIFVDSDHPAVIEFAHRAGGKDGTAMLWDLNEGKKLYSLNADDTILSLVFSPIRYWLCAATPSGIKIWDLESKVNVETLQPELPERIGQNAQQAYCTSLSWSADGDKLYSGYTDGIIRVWSVTG